ncbi:glyoxal oxidase N-terminus-domain-containing protein [Russula aff. rugulosa BPL654]|nr:glyoxal oxidase N-terminus-domain-containing protein [Russula aff. rugulosa BPL654]
MLPHFLFMIIPALIQLPLPLYCLSDNTSQDDVKKPTAKHAAVMPAWNGHTPPGTASPAPFTPYFVPEGATGYDSSSPFTTQRGAAFLFSFTGTGIEWFGCTGPRHGEALVYLNGRLVDRIDTRAQRESIQQRLFWTYDLPHKKHTFKVIGIDAIVVYKGVPPPPPSQQHAPRYRDRGHGHNQGQELARQPSHPSSVQAAQNTASSSLEYWQLRQQGSTGVAAMQLSIISQSHAIIIDKVEHNPLTVNNHPAWGALFNLNTYAVKALQLESNSFCAGGSFLGNGTLINGVRLFHPCEADDVADCGVYEYPARVRLTSPRWYNTVVRIQDGSVIIIGGSRRGGWMNNATTNNPTIEYYPPKNIHGANGTPIHLQFLVDTLNSNLFPIAFLLPDGRIFIAANRDAMLYDWKKNTEEHLPRIPNGVRVTYPMTGTGLLLPLAPENDYAPEVLICGGSTLDDKKAGSCIDQCARILLTEDGIRRGWQVEKMPDARTMSDAVLLATGALVILNGAGSGVGMSNADNPVLTPCFTTLLHLPIPRLYHSVATLTPNGDIMIAGSNPNLDRSEVAYGTEYRVEWLRPPYMNKQRPVIMAAPGTMDYAHRVNMHVKIPENLRREQLKVSLIDFGFVTHAVHSNSRLVYLVAELGEDGHTLTITGPPNGGVYPPGPGWLCAVKVMVGDGQGPPLAQGTERDQGV